MPFPLVANAAMQAALAAAPVAKDAALKGLALATDGRVKSLGDLKKYVVNPERLMVVTDALARVGIPVDKIIPDSVAKKSPQIADVKSAAVAAGLGQVAAPAVTKAAPSPAQPVTGLALSKDDTESVQRTMRARAALRVYGNAEAYALAGNGQAKPADFAFYYAMRAIINSASEAPARMRALNQHDMVVAKRVAAAKTAIAIFGARDTYVQLVSNRPVTDGDFALLDALRKAV